MPASLKVLPASCAAHFPDRPFVWLARGVHIAGGCAGHSCSVSVHTSSNRKDYAERQFSRESGRWMRLTSLTLWGITEDANRNVYVVPAVAVSKNN